MNLPEMTFEEKNKLRKIIEESDLNKDGIMTENEMKPILDYYFSYLESEFSN